MRRFRIITSVIGHLFQDVKSLVRQVHPIRIEAIKNLPASKSAAKRAADDFPLSSTGYDELIHSGTVYRGRGIRGLRARA